MSEKLLKIYTGNKRKNMLNIKKTKFYLIFLINLFLPNSVFAWISTSNPSSGNDQVDSIAVDSSYIYVAGSDNSFGGVDTQWRIEKRDINTGALVSAFDTDGVVVSNPSGSGDVPFSIAVDSTYIYVAGYDYALANYRWRIEKRDKTAGSLITGFDGDGVVGSNPSSSDDRAYSIAIDSNYIYVAGSDNSLGGGDVQWRIEKRDINTGALVTAFDGDGVVVSNPTTGGEWAYSIAVDSTYIYVVGAEFRIEKRDKTTGALVTAFDGDGVVPGDPSIGVDDAMSITVDSTYIYVAGFDSAAGAGNGQWRIEKRDKTTGALVTAFDSDGVVVNNMSTGDDRISSIAVDSTYIYVTGREFTQGSNNSQWRIEKRDINTGALITAFDGDGVVVNNPSAGNDYSESITVDTNYIYVAGFDYAAGAGNAQWRIEKRNITSGTIGNVPSLSWTGEANYVSDGLDPETGNASSTFIYRMKYTDADNDAPATNYPKVHIKKAGVEITDSPFTMSYVSGSYSTGAIYTYSTALSSVGTDYTYYFEAQDVWNNIATGTPTSSVDAPDIANSAPTLSWTAETNYTSDGLDPETGNTSSTFIYRVKYTDANNDAPATNYPKVHIKKAGVEITDSPFTMTYVSGSYSSGAIYTYSTTLSSVGTDYTYYFEAQDIYSAVATGTPTSSVDAPDVNNAPTLSWTGEANYVSDGLDPETGNTSSTFTYRVKYTDANNDAPATGYPKVHIKKAGVEITGSPFTMTYVSGSYSTGAIYTYSTTLSSVGIDYTYYFEAQDIYNAVATGTPTSSVDAPDVANSAPILAWTGETNYTTEGLDPETGNATTTFTYRVKYTDVDNDAPATGYPKVHIKKAGVEITGSPFTMTYVSGSYSSGAIYTYSTALTSVGTDYTYYFEAQDVWNNIATGTPTSSVDAPDVSNSTPTLDWTAETNYTTDGLDPETGNTSSTFTYRVKYTDANNDAPAAGYPKVHIKKGGVAITGSPFTMTYVSGSYSSGAIYTYSTTLSSVGIDYTYYFEAQDIYNAVATGTPTSSVDAPDVNNVPVLSWTGEANYVLDGLAPETGNTNTTFTYRVKYTDNDAPASGYPKIHIKKAGSEISGSPFTMTYVSGSYSTGAIYTYSTTLSSVGIDYTYYFEAQDIYNAVATGTPTSSVDVPDVAMNNAPTLSWTGETNYTTEGLDPETGNATTTFTFRVKYTDVDNDAPATGYPKVHIKKAGVEITGSPFTMTYVSGSYSSGAIYTYSTNLKTGGDYTYYFEAKDSANNTATGTPTNLIDAPDINVISANQDSTVVTEDGTQIDIPKGTLNNGVTINVTIPSTIPAGEIQSTIGSVKQTNVIKEITISDGTRIFNNEIKITIPFKDSDISGIDKSNLKLFYYSETNKKWILIPNSTVDTSKNTVSVYINHLTIFRIMAVEVTSAKLVLYNNLFNPANNEKLYIRYDLTKEASVTITVYDIIGEKIRELLNERRTAGSYTDLTWDGKNDTGEIVASGIYIIYIIADDFRDKKKAVIVK